MTESNHSAADESWAFALSLYAEPGVAEACLALQAEADMDVMLMLVVLHAVSQRKIVLTAADIAAMHESSRAWRDQVVRPLRGIRTLLKSGPAPAPSIATEKLRSQIKASELAAERLQNDYLAANLPCEATLRGAVTQQHIKDAILDVAGCNPKMTNASIGALLPAITTLVERTEDLVRKQI
jgi:uncharacterized protein (TIGR02444 family)